MWIHCEKDTTAAQVSHVSEMSACDKNINELYFSKYIVVLSELKGFPYRHLEILLTVKTEAA